MRFALVSDRLFKHEPERPVPSLDENGCADCHLRSVSIVIIQAVDSLAAQSGNLKGGSPAGRAGYYRAGATLLFCATRH